MVVLSPKQETALLSLYKHEIILRLRTLYFSMENARYLEELLALHEIEQLIAECKNREENTNEEESMDEEERKSEEDRRKEQEIENEKRFGDLIWNRLTNSSMRSSLYITLLNYLNKVDVNLHQLLGGLLERDKRSHFFQVLEHLKEFMAYTDVDVVLAHLKTVPQYASVVEQLQSSLKGLGADMRKCILLRTVPLFGSGAVYDILRGLYNCGDEAKAFVDKLYPDFLRFYRAITADRSRPLGLVHVCDVNTDVGALWSAPLTAEGRFAVDLKWENLNTPSNTSMCNPVDGVLTALEMNLHLESPIVLREYQKELCEAALRGENTVICAPTGSGKTPVAAHIIKNYLINEMCNGRNGKVLFLIPNTFILKQQAETMSKYLQHRFKVLATCGADAVALRPAIDDNNVIVTTPQMIVNLINEKPPEDMERPVPPFSLTCFGMIVFDEVHATRKNSPYNMIMKQYHRIKFSGNMRSGEKVPQIVGLTASLGIGDGKDHFGALKHITKTCAHLDCHSISTVRANKADLEKFSAITPDELKHCPDMDERREEFIRVVGDMMSRIEAEIMQIYTRITGHRPERSASPSDDGMEPRFTGLCTAFADPPSDKWSFGYENWLANSRNRLIPEDTQLDSTAKTKIITRIDLLKHLYSSLQMALHFSTSKAFSVMCDAMDDLRLSGVIDESRVQSWNDFKQRLSLLVTDQSAIVSEVVSQLVLQHVRNKDFRAIVFIRTRNYAKILSEILNSHVELLQKGIRTEYITGINSSPEGDGKSSKQKQADKLSRFESGKTRVIVSTSVAEEGLDIAKCNLVIKYNYATNEIAHVQRRGRGRAENSRCILLSANAALIKQEETNINKEKLMNEALEHIQRGFYPLREKVKEAIHELWQAIQKEDADRVFNEKKLSDKGIVYTLQCKKCSAELCKSVDIRHYNDSQYCVCNPTFWSKIRYTQVSQAEMVRSRYNNLFMVFCTQDDGNSVCGSCIGRVVKVANGNMPVLSANALKLVWVENNYPHCKTVKKWKEIREKYFVPEAMRNVDRLTMQEAAGAPRFSELIFNIDQLPLEDILQQMSSAANPTSPEF